MVYWFICRGKQVSLPDVWSLVSSFVTRYVATLKTTRGMAV